MSALEYRIVKKVGQGGSGVVYKAELSDGRSAAVKRLSAKYQDDRLEREAQLLASLDHPGIVKFFGVKKQKNDSLDLVMEWVGPSLQRVLESGALPLSTAVHVIRELLHALDYLHSTGKQHRDLSPGNLLLGDNGSVKLADLGLCKPGGAPRTTSVLKGTEPYVSPEQLGSGPLDARCDLFAVGVIFYELLTGVLPFQSSQELRRRPVVTPVSALRAGVPQQLEAVVMRLLEYERDKRCPSAASVLDALDDSPLARELGKSETAALLRRRARRRFGIPAVAAAVLVGGLLGVGGVSLYGGQGAVPEDAASPAAESTKMSIQASPIEREVADNGASQRVEDRTAIAGGNTGETFRSTHHARDARPRRARKPVVPDPIPETRDPRARLEDEPSRSHDEEHQVGRGEMVITDSSHTGVHFDLVSDGETRAATMVNGDNP